MTRLWLAWAAGILNGFVLFALVAVLATHCAGCAHETKPTVYIPALQPPSDGVPVYVWVPQWVRPALLCLDGRRLDGPIRDHEVWHCAYRGVEQ